MKNKEYQSINKMIQYIEMAKKYTNNITFEQFENDDMIVNATVFVLSQIGELVKNLDNKFQNENTNIKWYILKGLRNRIVHDYEGINLETVWAIIKEDITQLEQDLNEILNSNK